MNANCQIQSREISHYTKDRTVENKYNIAIFIARVFQKVATVVEKSGGIVNPISKLAIKSFKLDPHMHYCSMGICIEKFWLTLIWQNPCCDAIALLMQSFTSSASLKTVMGLFRRCWEELLKSELKANGCSCGAWNLLDVISHIRLAANPGLLFFNTHVTFRSFSRWTTPTRWSHCEVSSLISRKIRIGSNGYIIS